MIPRSPQPRVTRHCACGARMSAPAYRPGLAIELSAWDEDHGCAREAAGHRPVTAEEWRQLRRKGKPR